MATGADAISAEAAHGALFTGFERDTDPSYNQQLAKCLAGLAQQLGHLSEQPISGSDTGPAGASEPVGLEL